MKKTFSLILVLCFVLSLCACAKTPAKPGEKNESSEESKPTVSYADEVFAPARTYSKNGVAKKRTLSNTVYKLKTDKKLNVLYYGGSVTVGVGSSGGNSWAKKSEAWLKETYPDAEINCTNSAIGGTGVYYGNMRADSAVFAHKPDLLFIEFALNDKYENFYYAQSAYYLEMLIKRVNKELPQTDIVILFSTDKGKMGEKYENMAAYKDVADHYGIPCIDMGAELKKAVDNGTGSWEDYIVDYAHPNDMGYAAYSTAVINGLKKLLAVEGKKPADHALPKEDFIVSGINMDYKLVDFNKIKVADTWEVGKRKYHSFTSLLRPLETGAKFTYEFEGKSIGVFMTTEKGNTVIATIDGKEKTYVVTPDAEGDNEKLIFDNLAEGTHKIEIEYKGTKRFYIYAMFVG
ncbi:MAG: hypothetical protein E7531_07405 [Ruminococcaceae bacterium]|nr:hypothetical protein [Oscillospiraceae bacterium]